MREEIEQLLPLIKSGHLPRTELEALLSKIRCAIKDDPAKGKELGPFVSLVSQALKQEPKKAEIHWVEVGKGALAIGHKPGGKISFEGMKNEGVTAVLTLLKENEGAVQIGNQLKKLGIHWEWFPFSASTPHAGDEAIEVHRLFDRLENLLDAGHKIYVHCSAGIHRTGMITYGLLRYLGQEKKEALQMLRLLREVTADQAGEERLAWGDQFEKGKA